MSIDDTELIARILDGARDDYRLLIDRHKHSLYRHCFYITRDEDSAEDMAQEAFITAYHKLRLFEPGKASFKTWLFTIATRKCLEHLRRRRTLPLEEADLFPSSHPTPQQLAEAREIWQIVQELPPKHRIAISLYYRYGYSYDEISRYLKAPTSSVKSWLHRAKKQLKEALS